VPFELRTRECYRTLKLLDPLNQRWDYEYASAHRIECFCLAWIDCVIDPARNAWREWDVLSEPFRESSERIRRERWWRSAYLAVLAARAGDVAEARAQVAETGVRFDFYRERLPNESREKRLARIDFLQRVSWPLLMLRDWPALEHTARENLGEVDAALREEPANPDLLLGRLLALGYLGQVLLREGRINEAAPLLEQAVAGFRQTQLTWGTQWMAGIRDMARESLAEISRQRGDVARARELLESTLKDRESPLFTFGNDFWFHRESLMADTWLQREALASTLMQLAGTYSATDSAEKVRRAELLDRAWTMLDSPDADGRISVEGKATKAKIAALRAATASVGPGP